MSEDKKTTEPRPIEDGELDAASGGLLPAVEPAPLKSETTSEATEGGTTVLSGSECLTFFLGGRT